MATDYAAIRAENERRYGTDIGRIGPMLLADRYDDRAHFIYELLQNAEDALARRTGSNARRSITFDLSPPVLRVSHFGAPFTEADVRGICGIAEGTKDLTAIGRFGIGFKSVYAFTDRPQIHSAGEHFAVESFVWPTAIEPCGTQPEETVFILPLAEGDATAPADIAQGLKRLGPRALLFLRQIEEIAWSVEGGASGLYLRSKPEPVGENARRIVVIGQEDGAKDVVEETWLVFSREVRTGGGVAAGVVEVAFALTKDDESDAVSVRPVGGSALVVFFPTVVPTHLGFLVQGPYRTTPSRDNIPRHDPWNEHLVQETAALLVEALHSLRDVGLLNIDALQSLPLDRTKFGQGQMFAPLFDAVREALSSEPLLPRVRGGHASAKNVRLARTQELRELVSPSQLALLFGERGKTFWLSEDITQDRTPDLRQYLMRELGVVEATPETILPKLNQAFLEKQGDKWILQLYEFLHGQVGLLRQGRLDDVPLVRLEDGRHVTPKKDGQLQAFLPGSVATDFPTVRRAVCRSDAARALLSTLGLTEPDPVDDVVRNVLPKYAGQEVDVSDDDYEADIQRIVTAFGTDSKGQREKLLAGLRDSTFVMAVDPGDGSKWVSKPGDVYLATQRLKGLFEGVSDVLLVDDTYSCLRGEDVRELLEACGATRYLLPVPSQPQFTWEERRQMRRKGGCEDSSRGESIEDYDLRGLAQLLVMLPTLDPASAAKKTALLWEVLSDLGDRRGTRAFSGSYRWFYHYPRSWDFDAAFVRRLNEGAWVSDRNRTLQPPAVVVFEETGWKENPFLLSKIRFKPPIIEALAREAGIEPGVLDLLKKLGVTSEAELKARLGINEEPKTPDREPSPDNVDDALKKLLGETSEPTPPVTEPAGLEPSGSGGGGSGGSGKGRGEGSGGSGELGGRSGGSSGGGKAAETGKGGHERTPGSSGARPFISYLGTHPEDAEPDPDGLDQQARMALEDKAIALILGQEPELRRAPRNNPGFDLVAMNASGTPVKWVEVKAMTGTMQDRPVGLSRPQFEAAQERGPNYWLYVAEQAGSPHQARVVRIQDPAGRARTFTFDHGWLSIAEIDDTAGTTTGEHGEE